MIIGFDLTFSFVANMRRRFRLLVIFALSFPLSGCLQLIVGFEWLFHQNYVTEVKPGDWIGVPRERSAIVFGLRDEGRWAQKRPINVYLAEYSMERHEPTPGCILDNHAAASISAGTTETRYFAFLAPPGWYVSDYRSDYGDDTNTIAFAAPAGRVVYIGTFVNVTKDTSGGAQWHLQLDRDDIEAARKALQSFKFFRGDIELADTRSVGPLPPSVVCIP